MQIEAVEMKWLYPEMRELFEQLRSLQDDVWQKCREELGEDLSPVETATAIAMRHPYVTNPKRRAEIIEAYRLAAKPYADKMAELVGRYTVPTIIVKRER